MKEPFSTREWAGMLAPSGWGAVLPLVPFGMDCSFPVFLSLAVHSLSASTTSERERDSSTGVTIRYIGAGLLVFLAFGLIILGSILAVSGILNPSPSSHASAFDRAASFIGCVLATLGIGLAVFLCRRTGQLQVSKIVEELIGLLLAFLTLMLIPMIWTGTFDTTPCAPGDQSCSPVRGSDLFWSFVISVEGLRY